MYLKADLKTFDLNSLGTKFDVVMITPPLEEYQRRASGIVFPWKPWEWEDIMALKVEEVLSQRSFVFLWSGSSEGLDLGGCGLYLVLHIYYVVYHAMMSGVESCDE